MVGSFPWAAGGTAGRVDSGQHLTITARITHKGADHPARDRGLATPHRPDLRPCRRPVQLRLGHRARARPPARRSMPPRWGSWTRCCSVMTSTTTISIRPDEGCYLAPTRDRTSAMPATVANLGARSITDCEVRGHTRAT